MINWISVNDKLPKEYQKVLVGRGGAEGVFGLIVYRSDVCDDKYWKDSSYNMFAAPTHWAEVPDIDITAL